MAPIIEKIAQALHLPHKDSKKGESAPPATSHAPAPAAAGSAPAADAPKTQVFDSSKVTVIFVLGGPGAGKGTQCDKLVREFDFCHLSAGDLLRAEQNREKSEYGELIRTYIKEGQIVPMEITIKLLENAMRAALAEGRAGEGWAEGKGRFLIDGFPRKMDQALKFDEEVCQSSLVLFFTTTEEVMLKRLLKRGETSGREDDNEESIKKRFRTYKETTMPVIEHYNKQGKVASIDASPSIDEVYEKASAVIKELFAGTLNRNVTV
ncbi:UMP-CMP kinase [Gloeophyllum trabeum ATCC 11539]|uniref:Uridylate kinase n=1 Tax=Gloeophyllum trabeum (strain ATCC 11539 / FP-39264 / Madison 617) TaxID=670483 RepID=S7QFC4_GLOTA|nr:UMP-CMP kinase [Gloeophyllum trabeum ATCC 11539]EPQ58506.1 UMP-CMP kinase [Gloeophyllum trabeum ATCC 11539]